MSKSLIIVESPAKAATIKKYLGEAFDVEASAGHIKDLPERALGVDVDRDFDLKFEIVRGKKKIVERIRKAAAAADAVFLAPDPDREGEAIAWHIREEIGDSARRVERVLFHEITRDAVRRAIDSPRPLDDRMYQSQLARRTLDRLVGYQISPLLWRKVQGGLSAGRVQSVAVRLVVEREREIEAFRPEEFWVIAARLAAQRTPPSMPFRTVLRRIAGRKAEVRDRGRAEALLALLRKAEFRVAKIERKARRRPPLPPFITSTLQQEASRLLRFSPAHTMALAQRLYEGLDLGEEGRVGLITYMRTDSVRLSNDALAQAREVIAARFGPEYLPAKATVYRNRKSAQDAHEAIRPTSAARDPASIRPFLSRDEYRLYALIYHRFLACQMAPAIYDQTVVDVTADETEFRATGSVLRFDGHLAVWHVDRDAPRESEPPVEDREGEFAEAEGFPSDLTVGEELALVDLSGDQKFTEPPARFSEAALVRELEERGIGRPSTYATIVTTIQSKGYVCKVDGRLRPSELGRIVNDLLVRHFPSIVDYDFTARMEEDLDAVEEGRKDRLSVLRDFYSDFSRTLQTALQQMKSIRAEATPSGVPCDVCGKEMLIRFGKNGPFLGCSGYPECKTTREFERDESGHVSIRQPEDMGTCPKCGEALRVRSGRFGKFVACSAFPKCDFKRPYTRSERCPLPDCKGRLAEKQSANGRRFLSCSEYPRCQFITNQEPVDETCPSCGSPTLFSRSFRSTKIVNCLRPGCGYTRKETVRQAHAADG